MKRLSSILFALSVLAILVYWLVPERHFSEYIYPQNKEATLEVYDDRADGGMSSAKAVRVDSSLQFSCTLHEGEGPAWCGMLWNFTPDSTGQYHNWLLVDSVIFNIDVSGTDEFLLKIWTYDPDVTKIENKFSFRPLIKEVKVAEGAQRVAIPMEELYVPEYWFNDQKVDKSLELKHLEGVARLEITAGWNMKRGKLFSIKINSIEGKGVSSIALGLMIFFFLGVGIVFVGFRHKGVDGDRKK